MFVFLKRERLVQSVPMVEIIPDRPDALMKMISCFSVHHRWVSQILASNLPIVKHFYHVLHIVILEKYQSTSYTYNWKARNYKHSWYSYKITHA
jgi:hypothetical protein